MPSAPRYFQILQKKLYLPIHAKRSANPILLNVITLVISVYSTYYEIPLRAIPHYSSLFPSLIPNIPFVILILNTLSMHPVP
jgi:hypothetical protein